MARFGRRQPHAPTILRGLRTPGLPVGRVVVPVGQGVALAAAFARHRPVGHVLIVRGGGQPAVGRLVMPAGQAAARDAALARRRPVGRVFIIKGGGQPSPNRVVIPTGQTTALATALLPRRPVGRVSVVHGGGRQTTAQAVLRGASTSRDAANAWHRPLFQPVIRGLIRYVPPAPTVPIGIVVAPFGQAGSQAAAFARHRPAGRVFIIKGGGVAAVGRMVLRGDKVSRDASNFARRPLFQPVIRGLIRYVPPVSTTVPTIFLVGAAQRNVGTSGTTQTNTTTTGNTQRNVGLTSDAGANA